MISTWRQAHRVAQLAAVHAQEELGVPRDGYVDVFAAIRRADIALMFEALPGHFGTYICPASGGPGILINSTLSVSAIRHTAAHELGHHQLEHGDRNDRQLDPWESQEPGAWTGPEMSAEAFASWFLMPRRAVLRGLSILGMDRPRSAVDTYRLAQMLGASYRGLCRHLVNLGLVAGATAEGWARVGRARVRKALADRYAGTTNGEVHVIDARMGNTTVHVANDDLLIAPGWVCEQPTRTGGAIGGLEPVLLHETPQELPFADQPSAACWRVSELSAATQLGSDDPPAGAEGWSVLVRPVRIRDGIDLDWLERHQQGSDTRGEPRE